MLLSFAVSRAEDLLDDIALRDEQALSGPRDVIQEPSVAELPRTGSPSAVAQRRSRTTGWTAPHGRHAVPAPPSRRRGARFMIFSAIGGFVFLLGFGLQVVLTGGLHMQPVASYLIQAVTSVETSFLLNRWLTWRDRSTPFWPAFLRFNAQKTVTIALNLALYVGLLRLGMNYLIANVVLTIVFTVVNFVAGDRLVFIPGRTRAAEPTTPSAALPLTERSSRSVSVAVPCRNSEGTIAATVQSLLDQDYPGLGEILLVGSPGDRTWEGLPTVNDPRLFICEVETPPGMRDANFKRDAAIRMLSGELIMLVDSDLVLPPDWLSRAAAALEDSGASCVTGGMKSIHDSFWGRYTDSTWIGAKTPRITRSYTVTSKDFGVRGRKPPITANTLFTRELYEHCSIDPAWSHGSYEDYEWFWRVTRAGYGIFVCQDLFGWHHHRRGLRALAKEYRRSSRGCAYFIRTHPDCPLAKRRWRQVFILPMAGIAVVLAAAAASATGHGPTVAAGALGCAAILAVHQVARSRSLESLAYPVVGFGLGLVFTTSLAMNLVQSVGRASASPAASSTKSEMQTGQGKQGKHRLLHPVLAICAVQAALSLTLVWSNTAYIDEATYLTAGRMEIAHWLHGAPWPSTYAYEHFAGSPLIYPPLGAIAANVGGVAAARLLSLAFMILTTTLLYSTASRLIGRGGGLFAAGLWALSEPAVRMAFASFDPLSALLTALSAWIIVRAGFQRRRAELVAAAALTMALANVTAYSGVIIDPVVAAFAFMVWLRSMSWRQSLSCTAWLTAAWILFFGLLMTGLRLWPGFYSTVFAASAPGNLSASSVLGNIWFYSGLILCLGLVGVAACYRSDHKDQAALLGLLCCATLMVPIAQLNDQTVWSIDMHLSYGIWFAAMPAGYACSRFVRWLPGAGRPLVAASCVVAFVYPAVASWQSAWERYHAWPDASSFIDAFKPIAAQSKGSFYLPARETDIAEFYTPQGSDLPRWSGALSLDPAPAAPSSWRIYYSAQLKRQGYGVIALFYSTTFSSVTLPESVLLSPSGNSAYQELLSLVGANSGEPGLPALTQALETDQQYRLAAVGRYNTSNISGTHDYGIYAIWQRKEQG